VDDQLDITGRVRHAGPLHHRVAELPRALGRPVRHADLGPRTIEREGGGTPGSAGSEHQRPGSGKLQAHVAHSFGDTVDVGVGPEDLPFVEHHDVDRTRCVGGL
jgi:hypothetical protein